MEPKSRRMAQLQKPRRNATSPEAPPSGGPWVLEAETGALRLSDGARRAIHAAGAAPAGDLADLLPVNANARRRVKEAIARCLATGAGFDLTLSCNAGHAPAMLRVVGGAVPDADGVVRRLTGVFCDIGEETRMVAEIAARRAHVRSILETAPDGMVVIDEAGRIDSFNSAAQRMFGYSEAEAVGRNVSILMGEPDYSRHSDFMARYRATGERRIIGIGRIVTGRRKDGSQFPLHLSIGETEVDGRRLFTSFMHDLTEERRSESRTQALQAELAHISRLSALGEMGSALAHELNQPLAAIGNYITGSRRLLADARSPATARVEAALSRAAEQVLRAGQIIRRLRDFVSRRGSDRRIESLARLVEEASALGLVGAREKGVTLKFRLDPAHDTVYVDRIQIQQVLVNLLRNGLDAMETSARRDLTVSSRRLALGFVEVAVSDTGAGLASDTAARLFEPFFTTKPAGLGVGLSISRGIVEAHGGEMRAENNEGDGATFRFTLPLPGEDGA
jgi:two-component system, LuxR family, sensor kinase FixL